MANGIDFAFNPHPGLTAIRASGASFVGRYVSPQGVNDTNGKNLLAGECRALLGAGLSVIIYAEQYAARMREGRQAGIDDARHADAVTAALGMKGIPIYFAADWDATPADQVGINAYLDGAAGVIGRARTGIYGGLWPVRRALDAGKARYAVQTVAWSGGEWDSRANIRQMLYVRVGGVQCDVLKATGTDYGQWPRPAAQPPKPAALQRFEADGKQSLREAVNARGTSVAEALWLMARNRDSGFGPQQRAYIRGEDWDAPMPQGLVYWTGPVP